MLGYRWCKERKREINKYVYKKGCPQDSLSFHSVFIKGETHMAPGCLGLVATMQHRTGPLLLPQWILFNRGDSTSIQRHEWSTVASVITLDIWHVNLDWTQNLIQKKSASFWLFCIFQNETLSTPLSFTVRTDCEREERGKRLAQSINKRKDIKTTTNLAKRVRTKCCHPCRLSRFPSPYPWINSFCKSFPSPLWG